MGNRHSTKPHSPVVSRNGSRKSCAQLHQQQQDATNDEDDEDGTTAADQPRTTMGGDDQPIQLTPYQKTILRDAWQRISKKGAGNIGSQIFRRMMNKNSDIKKLFQHVTGVEGVFSFGLTPIKVYRHHSVLFVKVLDSAIANLDDLRPFVLECVAYGAKHGPYRSYGFGPDMWDVFGESMTESAREWEGWKKHRETLRAWTILISFIVDRMRQGYESAVRKETFMQQLNRPSIERLISEDRAADQSSSSVLEEEDGKEEVNEGANEPTSSSSPVAPLPKKLHHPNPSRATNNNNKELARLRRQSNAVIRKAPVLTRSKSALEILGDQVLVNEDEIRVQL